MSLTHNLRMSQYVHTFGRSFLASRPRKVIVSTVVIPEDKNFVTKKSVIKHHNLSSSYILNFFYSLFLFTPSVICNNRFLDALASLKPILFTQWVTPFFWISDNLRIHQWKWDRIVTSVTASAVSTFSTLWDLSYVVL